MTPDNMIESNRMLGRNFFAAQDHNHGPLDPALVTPDYKAILGGNPAMDRTGHDGFGAGFYVGFPDIKHHIEDVIATPDTAVVRFVLRGTHTGSFFGIPATNKTVAVTGHIILRIRDGKVHTLQGVFDEAGMLRQLGVLPS